MASKKCGMCKETKNLNSFGTNTSFADGKSTRCQECSRTYSREYYRKNKAKIYKPVAPGEDLRRARYSQWAEGLPPEDIPEFDSPRYNLAKRIWRTAKVSLMWYEIHSRHGCEICWNETDTLVIDHDHSCCPEKSQCGQCARGTVCLSCNGRLSAIDNGTYTYSPDDAWLFRALLYVQPGHQSLFHFLG